MSWSATFQWLTLAQQLAHARSRPRQRSAWSARCAQRAAACLALAEVARRPAGTDEPHPQEALGLCRSACVWLLAGLHEREAPVAELAGEHLTEAERASCAALLARDAFADEALPAERLEAELASLRALALRLQQELVPGDALVRRLWLVRTARLAAVLAAAALLAGLAMLSARRLVLGPDLSQGKPWRTSSTALTCEPMRRFCGSNETATDIFFHTAEEDFPWLELDLGTEQKVGRVELANRTDCCQARAVPLAVELSSDRTQWKVVATRNEQFQSWTAVFSPASARYVRLRVLRRSVLHLEAVSVRR